MRCVHILVDYDNATEQPEKGAIDVELNLASLLTNVGAAVRANVPDSEEVWCRLYGGWWTKGSQMTMRATWLLAEVSKFRGRRYAALRTKLTIASALIAAPEKTLIGTHRSEGQKMVDGMISTDLLELSMEHDTSLALISDDDDFVPSLIRGSLQRRRQNPILLLRHEKASGDAPNDRLLTECNIKIVNY